MVKRRRPGEIRDAIVGYLSERGTSATVAEIRLAVVERLGEAVADSSVRSSLRLNTGDLFVREARGRYRMARR